MKLEFKTKALGEFEDIFTGEKYERLKASILTVILRQKDLLFRNSVDPDGKPWQPLATLSEKRKIAKNAKITNDKKKQKKTKILVDTSNLKNSLSVLGGGNSIQDTTGDSISVGTNVEYAAIHNFGGQIQRQKGYESKEDVQLTIIPARPFIGLGDDDLNQINEKIENYIDKNSRAS